MTVTVKQIITRPSLHDIFWFELYIPDEQFIYFENFRRSAETWIHVHWEFEDLIKNKEKLRPDVIDKINSQEIVSQFDTLRTYNPLSLVYECSAIFKDLEEFRKANQEMFNKVSDLVISRTKQTNNINQEEVYDENGVFLEYGLFTTK